MSAIRLKEMSESVTPINFGSPPFEPLDDQGRPMVARSIAALRCGLSRRSGWNRSKRQRPDSDSLQADACAPGYKYDSNTRLVLESKDDRRKRGVISPDEWDAVVLTFAEPVSGRVGNHRGTRCTTGLGNDPPSAILLTSGWGRAKWVHGSTVLMRCAESQFF